MKATLLHNPGAGTNKPSKEDLVDALGASGYTVRYQSIKEKGINWEAISRASDIIVVAGGDGTVGKISRKLVGFDVPIGILPVGTANNIATSFNIKDDYQKLIPKWSLDKRKKLSVGLVEGALTKRNFVESVGYGLFTHLMKEVYEQEQNQEKGTPDEEIQGAVDRLLELLNHYKPQYFEIRVDGKDLSGEYLMVEIMNIKCIGPNLMLAPVAKHFGDEFDIVLIGEKEKQILADYFKSILARENKFLDLAYHSGKEIEIKSEAVEAHIDDEVIASSKGEGLKITFSPHHLEFLTV